MKSFNVIWWDFNEKEPEPYDIIPYFVNCYKDSKERPKTFDEFREFIKSKSMYMYWARCEYEIIIKEWPPTDKQVKWDIHKQVMMNIDIITEIVMKEVL